MFGLLLVGIGLTGPALPSPVIVTMVVLGVSVSFIGATFPWIQELEIGPSGLKAKLKVFDASAPLLVELEPDSVMRFARLTCADAIQAQESVEKALAKTAERRVARDDRDMYTLRRLIDLLESAADRQWLHQNDVTSPVSDVAELTSTQVAEVLQRFSFFQRVAFLLRNELGLLPSEVSTVLECSTEDVIEAIAAVRNVVFPSAEPQAGPSDE